MPEEVSQSNPVAPAARAFWADPKMLLAAVFFGGTGLGGGGSALLGAPANKEKIEALEQQLEDSEEAHAERLDKINERLRALEQQNAAILMLLRAEFSP